MLFSSCLWAVPADESTAPRKLDITLCVDTISCDTEDATIGLSTSNLLAFQILTHVQLEMSSS